MIKYLLSFFAALIAFTSPVTAQDLEGTWALQIDDASVFVFALEEDNAGNWRGSWLRPARFQGTGVVFSQFRGSEEAITTDGAMDGDVLVMRFPPTQEGGSTDVLHFRLTGEYQAEMTYTGTDLEPYPLVRVIAGTELGPFSDDRIYDRDNAATQADYDPTDEPVAGEPVNEPEPVESEGAEPEASEPEAPEDISDEAVDKPAEEQRERLSDDFLDGLEEDAPPATIDTGLAEDIEQTDTLTLVRACEDIDRNALPSAEELAALWGDDFESIGSGLDIREYTMENGDIARVTLLGDRIYLNSCGPAS